MMLADTVRAAARDKGIALMTHLVCGYPSFEDNWTELEAMDSAGVDVVELQFPFSEPMADGPLFLRANQESLNRGTKLKNCFEFMQKAARRFQFSLLMMGYYNTPFSQGIPEFCRRLKESGGVGMIIPDLPIEEADEILTEGKKNQLTLIRLVAPTNSDSRMDFLAAGAEGFVYAVARAGVTGTETQFAGELQAYLSKLRVLFPIPLAVGFGISKPEDLYFLRSKADMAVVGTSGLKAYLSGGGRGLEDFLNGLRKAVPK